MGIMGNLINSCYVFIWDIKMDWGFFEGWNKKIEQSNEPNSRVSKNLLDEVEENFEETKPDKITWDKIILREETVYGKPWIYCLAIIQNFIIRFRWILYEVFMIHLFGPRGRLK